MIHFKIAQHSIRNVEMVEVWNNGIFVASIYPDEHDEIRIVSKYLQGVEQIDPGNPLPAWRFLFRDPKAN